MLPFFIIVCLTLSTTVGEKLPGQVRLHPRSPVSGVLKTTSRKPVHMIGVDLGMSYVSVGVNRKDVREVLTNEHGIRIMPFYVAFAPDGERLIGEAAKNQLTTNPENTVFDVKRLIGRTWDDPSVQSTIAKLPYKVVNVDNHPRVEVSVGTEHRQFSPENITALFLAKMRDMASSYLEENVTHVFISVPAYFNDRLRIVTREAAMSVGFKYVRIYNEPFAACLGHDLDAASEERPIVVYNLDETVFDVTLVLGDNGVFDVLSSRNNADIGTHSFDERILRHMLKLHETKTGILLSDIKTVTRLRAEVQKATRALNTQLEHNVTLPEIDFSETITRSLFEQLNEDLIESTLELTREMFKDTEECNITDVQDVVLVGSGARIPRIKELLQALFNGTAPRVHKNPEETVITGLTRLAHRMGSDEEIYLCDFNPISIGVEIEGGVMTKVIPRITYIPVGRSVILTTTEDNQDTAVIRIFKGERPLANQNRLVEELTLENIERLPKGVPQINVTFEIDVNGGLRVTAREEYSGRNREIHTLNHVPSEKDFDDIMEADYSFDDDAHKVIQITLTNFKDYLRAIHDHLSRDMSPDLSEQEKLTLRQHVNDGLDWLKHSENAEYEDIVKRLKEAEDLFDPFLDKLFPAPGKKNPDDNGHDEL